MIKNEMKQNEIEVYAYCQGNPICVDGGKLKTIRLNVEDENAIEKAFLEMFKNEDISWQEAKDFQFYFDEVNGKQEWFCYSEDFELTSVSPENYGS